MVCSFSEGVQLLSYVRSADDDSEKTLRGLRMTLLLNQVRDSWIIMIGVGPHDLC